MLSENDDETLKSVIRESYVKTLSGHITVMNSRHGHNSKLNPLQL